MAFSAAIAMEGPKQPYADRASLSQGTEIRDDLQGRESCQRSSGPGLTFPRHNVYTRHCVFRQPFSDTLPGGNENRTVDTDAAKTPKRGAGAAETKRCYGPPPRRLSDRSRTRSPSPIHAARRRLSTTEKHSPPGAGYATGRRRRLIPPHSSSAAPSGLFPFDS